MSRACRATLAVITLSVTLTLLLSRPAAEAPNDGELIPGVDYVPGEVFVVFRPLYMPQPAGIALERARFGIPAVDQFLAQHGAKQMRRFLTTYDQCKSEGGRRLERTYLIRFRGPVDTELLVSQLSRMPHFEHVAFNQILKKVFHGTKRFVPDAGTTEFDEQWNLDYYKDKIDIDAPEAWAIERGSGEVVIVINDSGTMMDTCGTGGGQSCATKDSWTIHSDFNHYWISEEDSASNGVLNRYDITQTDNNGDGVNDNIIGYNFAPGYEADTTASGDPSYQLAFWHSMPTPLLLSTASPEEASSWNCVGYWTHGTRVGGIAAAQVEGNDIVGVANECKVYWVRAGLSANANASIEDEADAIIHSAIYADVINMSWGFEEEPDVVLRDALSFAANDSD